MSDPGRLGRRDLEHVGALIDGVVDAVGAQMGLGAVARLWAEWAAIAGPLWAGSTPVRLEDGVLTVAVSNGAAATRLRYEVGGLLGRIGSAVGAGSVSSVRLQVRRP